MFIIEKMALCRFLPFSRFISKLLGGEKPGRAICKTAWKSRLDSSSLTIQEHIATARGKRMFSPITKKISSITLTSVISFVCKSVDIDRHTKKYSSCGIGRSLCTVLYGIVLCASSRKGRQGPKGSSDVLRACGRVLRHHG